jgi:hypothetical protein
MTVGPSKPDARFTDASQAAEGATLMVVLIPMVVGYGGTWEWRDYSDGPITVKAFMHEKTVDSSIFLIIRKPTGRSVHQ